MEACTIVNSIETDEIVVSLRTDGIVHVHIKADTQITLKTQDDMLVIYWQITKIKRPFIFTGGEFVTVSKEARLNATKMESLTPVAASAIVVQNLAQRIIANYYYKFNKPKTPYRIFKDVEKAADWLNENFQIS